MIHQDEIYLLFDCMPTDVMATDYLAQTWRRDVCDHNDSFHFSCIYARPAPWYIKTKYIYYLIACLLMSWPQIARSRLWRQAICNNKLIMIAFIFSYIYTWPAPLRNLKYINYWLHAYWYYDIMATECSVQTWRRAICDQNDCFYFPCIYAGPASWYIILNISIIDCMPTDVLARFLLPVQSTVLLSTYHVAKYY